MKLCNRLFVPVVALFLVSTATVEAQRANPWVIEAYGQFVVPGSDLGDVTKAGWGFGVGLGYYFTPAVSLTLSGNWARFGGKDEEAVALPDWISNPWSLMAGYDLVAEENYDFVVSLGAGGMRLKQDIPPTTAAGGASWNTYFAIYAGAKFIVWATPSIGLMASANFDYPFVTKEEGETESATIFTIPLRAGFTFGF